MKIVDLFHIILKIKNVNYLIDTPKSNYKYTTFVKKSLLQEIMDIIGLIDFY